MTYSPGQITLELDYFFRRLHTGEIPLDRKYVVIWPSESRWLLSDIAHDTQKMYHELFHIFIVNNLIYYFILPLISRFPDITCDCGISPENCLVIAENGRLRSKTFPLISRENRSCQEYLERLKHWNTLRLKTPGFCPLKPTYPMTSELMSFLDEVMPKYAVIQVRSARVNGTLNPTDSLSYLEAIDFLRQNGFKIVFGGREAIPEIFSDLGVLNYANWEHASFFHDLHLIANSSFALSSASGFAMMPSVMDIPLVYSNQWIIAEPMPGRLTVNVPTLLRNSDGRLMRFADQIDYSIKTWGESDYYYNPHKVTLEPRIATSRELLEATKEALSLKDTFHMLSDLQSQFNSLNLDLPIGNVDSRISQYFIENHQDLL